MSETILAAWIQALALRHNEDGYSDESAMHYAINLTRQTMEEWDALADTSPASQERDELVSLAEVRRGLMGLVGEVQADAFLARLRSGSGVQVNPYRNSWTGEAATRPSGGEGAPEPDGEPVRWEDCERCGGTGEVAPEGYPCSYCEGGRVAYWFAVGDESVVAHLHVYGAPDLPERHCHVESPDDSERAAAERLPLGVHALRLGIVVEGMTGDLAHEMAAVVEHNIALQEQIDRLPPEREAEARTESVSCRACGGAIGARAADHDRGCSLRHIGDLDDLFLAVREAPDREAEIRADAERKARRALLDELVRLSRDPKLSMPEVVARLSPTDEQDSPNRSDEP